MDNRAEVREFLVSRRAKITPQQSGMSDSGNRRVPGLRRGEVAALAGVSVEYYSKLERVALSGVSASVLDALARALQLDEAERAHLFNLAHAADGISAGLRPRRGVKTWAPRPALRWVLDGITTLAIIRNRRMDLLATNRLGRAMHASVYDHEPGDPPNFARYTFLHDDAHRFYLDWDTAADTCVAILRTEAGRDPHDKPCTTWSASCPPRSEEFRRRWGRHDVRLDGAGTKYFHHTLVGDLELAYESVEMIADPGLTLTIYAAEPASPTAHALDLLGSWTSEALPQRVLRPGPVPDAGILMTVSRRIRAHRARHRLTLALLVLPAIVTAACSSAREPPVDARPTAAGTTDASTAPPPTATPTAADGPSTDQPTPRSPRP